MELALTRLTKAVGRVDVSEWSDDDRNGGLNRRHRRHLHAVPEAQVRPNL